MGALLVLDGKCNSSGYCGIEFGVGSLVGAVIAAGVGGCGLAAVSVSGSEVEAKSMKGVIGNWCVAPFSAGGFEEASVGNDGVPSTDGSCSRNWILASSGEGNGVLQLGEYSLDGAFGVPGFLHGGKVGF